MNYQYFPSKIAILGAAGKMGSGITLLTALEVTRVRLTDPRSKNCRLFALDISESALDGLKNYLRTQITKKGEKDPDFLRSLYSTDSLTSNEQLINKYIKDVFDSVVFLTDLKKLPDIELILEAVNENPELKASLINDIKKQTTKSPIVFSNTSSIPINEIEKSTELEGRVIGFHFYNPPAIQKLIELVTTTKTEKSILEFASAFAKNIKKVVVPSNDIPGFIGNGHFMRDMLFGFSLVENLSLDMPLHEALFMVNYISQTLLIRPMGIFQLVDYVGLDVCVNILKVMNSRIIEEDLHSDILNSIFEQDIIGGQNPDGSQKDGIFQYEKGSITAIYNYTKKNYVSVKEIADKIIKKLEIDDISIPIWKEIIGDSEKEYKLAKYFNNLFSKDSLGADLTKRYLIHSKQIGENLIKNGVTSSPENVNQVLLLGFYHVYGPINIYC